MYVYRVLVCDLLNAPETYMYFVVLYVCLHLFVNGVQHLEYHTGCLKFRVSFPTLLKKRCYRNTLRGVRMDI